MIGSEATAPPRVTWREAAALALIVAAGASLRLSHLGVGFFNMYAARDYFRALDLIHGVSLPAAGSEMLYGGRTVGWFYYLLLSVPLTLSPSPIGGIVLIGVLDALALVVTHFAVRRVLGVGAALGATALFAAAPIEIVMGRFMWNPAFLPLFNAVALAAMLRWRVEGDRRALAVLVVAFGLAFQIHFSVYVHLVLLLLFLLTDAVRRLRGVSGRAPNRPLLPLLVGLLALAPFLWPYAARELATRWGNLRSITEETTDYAQVPISDMFAPRVNPTAVRSALSHLRVDLREDTTRPNYTCFDSFVETLEPERSPLLRVAEAVAALSRLQSALFAIGLVSLLWVLARGARAPVAVFLIPDRARTLAFILVAWLAITFLGVAFIRLEGFPYPRVVPSRYFTVWYPVPQIVELIGLRVLLQSFAGRPGAVIATAAVGLLTFSQAVFVWIFFAVSAQSGAAFNWTGRPGEAVTNVGDKMRLAEILVTERGLNLRAFRERTSTDTIYNAYHHEECIDYEMRAQPGFVTRPDPATDVHFFLMDRETGTFPFPPERVEVLHTDEVGRLRAITFRVTDPTLVIPRQVLENGFEF